MARGVNKVVLIGNLGADPEVRYSASGTAMCSVSLATSESWKDKQSGEAQERTEWHRVKFFGRLAEIAGEYLKKGRQIYVEGSLRTNKYTDKEGIERWSTDIVANEMQMLGHDADRGQDGHQQGRAQQASRSGAPSNGGQQNRAPQGGSGHPQRGPAPQQQAPEPAYAGGGGGFEEDDIPFDKYQRGMYV